MDRMIEALLRPGAYDHPVQSIELLETHISWILLTGPFAYKLKKPVDLGFVDFSTPERRRWFCQEELRLNRRLAPGLYVDLPEVHGPRERAAFHGDGPVLEVAVRMRQFRQEDLLPRAFERGAVTTALIEQLADTLVAFHADAAVAPAGGELGGPDAVRAPALANLEVLTADGPAGQALDELDGWTRAEAERRHPFFAARRAGGAIRECHGDLHLGNMVLHQGRIEVFDCLEFSASLRWIDPVSDMAFLVMDLDRRGRADAAWRVLNRWLEGSGDYRGLHAWRWYRIYRALVRAKVATLRLRQGDLPAAEAERLGAERQAYLDWAGRISRQGEGALVITHGVSGSGKSHLARHLCAQLGWIHLRSDVERRRLLGRWGPASASAGARFAGDPYRPEVSEHLYAERLPACAAAVLDGGLSLIVDATFLRRRDRQRLRRLAERRGARFLLLDCRVSPELARQRIAGRRRRGGDPSEADADVLAMQLRQRQEPGPDERDRCLTVLPPMVPQVASGDDRDGFAVLAEQIRRRLEG
jgi:hypothetical protein